MTAATGRTILLRFAFPSICASLGTWQIFRWKRKQEILRNVAEQMASPPKEIDSISQISAGCKFNFAVISTGERAILGPRGLSSALGYGYTLFEKAILKNGEVVVLNRGNLSAQNIKDPIPLINSTIIVVEDSEERRPLFARKNTTDQILWKDWAILKKALGINPADPATRFLKVISNPIPDTKSVNFLSGHTLSMDQIPNRHLEYIATWYSLAGLSVLMSFLRK